MLPGTGKSKLETTNTSFYNILHHLVVAAVNECVVVVFTSLGDFVVVHTYKR